MTAPTHAAFGVLFAALTNASYSYSIASAFGALLPDIDHPQSAIGRIFFFISHPLNLAIGHRGYSHSFLIWGGILGIGFLTHPVIQWLAIGALSHVLIDCYTLNGVQALLPLTERTVVIFKKDWRVRTGSTGEIFIFLLIFGGISATQYSYTFGGPRKLINKLMKSPQITVDEFTRAGDKICYIKGQFRWSDGRIEQSEWLIVGKEEQNLAFWNGERIIRNGKHGEFLRSTLKQSEQEWPAIRVHGLVIVFEDSFFFDGKKWHLAPKGSKAYGSIKSVSGKPPEIQVQSSLSEFFRRNYATEEIR